MPTKSLGQLQQVRAKAADYKPIAPEKPKGPVRHKMTPKRQQVFEFICKYIADNSNSPTVREIGAAVGLESSCSVDRHLLALEEMGYITRKHKAMRSIRITGMVAEALSQDLVLRTQAAILDKCRVCLEAEPLRLALREAGWRV